VIGGVERSLGTSPRDDGVWEAICWAPRADRVAVVFEPDIERIPLDRAEGGYCRRRDRARRPAGARLPARDRRRTCASPTQRRVTNPKAFTGPSALFDPGAHRWNDLDFGPPALRNLVLYELHVGTFRATPDRAAPGGRRPGTFPSVAESLR